MDIKEGKRLLDEPAENQPSSCVPVVNVDRLEESETCPECGKDVEGLADHLAVDCWVA